MEIEISGCLESIQKLDWHEHLKYIGIPSVSIAHTKICKLHNTVYFNKTDISNPSWSYTRIYSG